MSLKRILLALFVTGLMTTLAIAQTQEKQTGWGSAVTPEALDAAHVKMPVNRAQADDSLSATSEQREERTSDARFLEREPLLVGTWNLTVSVVSGNTMKTFTAMQTYNAGSVQTDRGTLVDRSEAPGNVEGPGHGVWSGRGRQFITTFETFEFNEKEVNYGRVRVKTIIHIDSEDHLSGRATIDFILPNGNVVPNIAQATFQATRMKVESPQ